MKKYAARLLLFLFAFLIAVSVPADAAAKADSGALAAITLGIPGDVGNHNDYGGGGGGGGGDYGGGGGTYYGGGGGSSSGGSLSPIMVVVVIGILVVWFLISRKGHRAGTSTSAGRPSRGIPYVKDNSQQIVTAITGIDPLFSQEKFIGWAKEVFITLQQAWTARDWSKIRPFEKEELFRQHEMQLQEYINLGRINVIERINVNQAYLNKYVRDAQYEYLTVFMATRMNDYIIDEKTKAVIKGDPNQQYFMNYLLTFMRKTGVKTNPATSNKSTTSCPNCGAPTQITSAGKCEYCDFIITTGEHDWVLCNLDSVKANTLVDNVGVVIHDDDDNGTPRG